MIFGKNVHLHQEPTGDFQYIDLRMVSMKVLMSKMSYNMFFTSKLSYCRTANDFAKELTKQWI